MTAVSVFIPTFNRAALLGRALASVLKQDFRDLEVVVIDDASTDDTARFLCDMPDPRVRVVRHAVNVGAVHGDIAILREFLRDHCRGESFVYLCDDDYWRPDDLLSTQVNAMIRHPTIAFAQGGMVHCYPHPVPDLAPNEPGIRYEFLDREMTQVFWGGVFPSGFIPRHEFLRLFADDPKNRNLVVGATLFRTALFRDAGILDRAAGVRWQAGYALIAGMATRGDVYYLDEPCLMTAVDRGSASHRGTQLAHMLDCFASVRAAFNGTDSVTMTVTRDRMLRSIFAAYMRNKIAHKWGWFTANALGDLDDIMEPPISAVEFEQALDGIELSADNRKIIEVSDLPLDDMLRAIGWDRVLQMTA